MILYHGSFIEVSLPDTVHSRPTVDFSKGFYTTPIYEQAIKWCQKIKSRKGSAVISIYEFDENAYNELNVLNFEFYSEKWLDFILTCRHGDDNSDYDIVIGGVANDKVFNTVELYFDNLIDKSEALRRLKFEQPNLQVCFRSHIAIDQFLKFIRSEIV